MKKSIVRIVSVAGLVYVLMSFQIIKTQLNVTIRNELGNTEEGVTVQLYEKEEDYKAEKNVVMEATTDEKGIAKFKELKSIPYFVLAKKGDKNNFGAGEQTAPLEAKRINKVTIVIE